MWTEEDIIARGQRYIEDQARERKRVVRDVHHSLAGLAVTCNEVDQVMDIERQKKGAAIEFLRSRGVLPPPAKVGRIKGVAPVADRTYDGRVYHSKAEMTAAMQLDFQLKAGLIRRWTPQVPYPIIVNGVSVCKVVIDFEVENLDGSIEAIEVKGFQTELYRLKVKLLNACFPALKYKVVRAK